MAAAAVTSVKADSITCQQPAHQRGDGNGAGLQQKMEMIGNQRPGETWGLGFYNQVAQPVYEVVAVLVVKEDLTPFDSSDNDVVDRTGGIDSRLSGHFRCISENGRVCKYKYIKGVPILALKIDL